MTEDPVAVLSRWEAAGAVWRVVGRDGDTLTVALCQCDGARRSAGSPRPTLA